MKQTRKFLMAIFASMLPLAAAWADDVVKNTTTETSYATLQDAFYEANAGDVIELTADVDATGDEAFSSDFNLGIDAGITLDGNNHTLTVNRRGISVAPQSSNSRMSGAPAKAPSNTINVTIKDLTIRNVAAQVQGKGGQIINTRGGIGTLTLDNVTFDTQGTTYNRAVRPLVIGGNQSSKATVNITNCTFTNPTAQTGNNSIAINVLNPVTMNIEGTTINAQYAINLGGADLSYGSQGSEVTFDGSTVTATVGAAVLFDFDGIGSGANGSTVTLTGETKITTPSADWFDMGDTQNNTIVSDHFATNYISATKYETKPTIQIATVADLQELATLVNSSANNTAGNTYELTNSLDLKDVNWTPIGNTAASGGQAFHGTFDGKGHTISNLTINDETANWSCAALFGSVYSGTIKNLTLEDVNIQSHHYAAAFVAYNGGDWVKVENCHVKGGSIVSTPELVGASYNNGDKVGAIVGLAQDATIKDCSVEGVTLQAYRDLGSLGGYITNGTLTGNRVENITIIQSDENGYLTKSDGSLQDMSYTVGEVVGGRSGANVQAQANDPSKNATENVTIESTGILAKIGDTKFSTVSAAVAAATEGQTVEICMAGTYTLPNIPENITIKGDVEGVVFNSEGSGNIASVSNGATFENVTMNFGKNNYHGFQHAGTINMNGCTLNGKFFSYGDMNFTDCTFNAPVWENEKGETETDYSMWAYAGNLTYTDCLFNCAGKCINVYNEDGTKSYAVTATGCTFNSTTANKAAFNVKATSDTKPLSFGVTIEDCTATGYWPEASESETLVVLNELVQVDDINANVASVIEVVQDGEVLYTTRIAEYAGNRYNTLQEALDAAEAADDENIVINLLNDATLDINARADIISIGTANTETITINGNGKTLTFNQKGNDWNDVSTANDEQTKLNLNDMTINNSGYNSGHWKRNNIFFSCAVEMNNVTATAVGFKNDAKLNNVTINDNRASIYGIWIVTNGQNVEINGLTINTAGNGGRGIAIKDEDSDKVDGTSLTINDATFTTDKKAAILVTSSYTVDIEASDINIDGVAADDVNAVWVDEAKANVYGLVTLTGDATMIPEEGVDYYSVVRKTGDKVEGYYKNDLAKALAEAKAEQTIELKADFELSETKNTAETPLYFEANDHKVTLAEGVKVYAKDDTYTEVFITTDATVSSIEVTEVNGVFVYEATAVYYAKIGDNKYRSLQEAVDAAYADLTGDQTITLLKDIEAYTVVRQKVGLNLTIDGQDKAVTMKNQIVIDGDGRAAGTETLTIKGIKFEGDKTNFLKEDAFITIPNIKNLPEPFYRNSYNYAHNVTIENCSFTSTSEDYDVVGVKATSAAGLYNLTMSGVEATNLHSLAQLMGTTGATIENCTVNGGESFANIDGGSGEVIIKNNEFASAEGADGYGLRLKGGSSAIVTLEENNFKAISSVVLGKGDAPSGTINIVSGTYVGDIVKNTTAASTGKIAISGGHFSAEISDEFVANLYYAENGMYVEETPEAPNGVKHYPYVVDETGYKVFAEAVAAVENASTLTLWADAEMEADQTSELTDAQSFTLTFGEYSIEQNGFVLKLERGVSVTTDKETDLFAPVNATDMVTVSGNYTYTVVSKESEGIYELVDGTPCPYALESNVQAEKVTYTRNISSSQVDKYQPWFVPFDYTITEEDLENFTFYKINMIANAPEAGEASEASDDVWVFLNEMNAGDVVRGNKPYIFMPKAEDSYVFTAENTEMKAKTSDMLLQTATTTATYSFYGTYESITLSPSDVHRDYYIGSSGKLSYPSARNIALRPYRWYMRMEVKNGIEYARNINFIEGDGESITGLHNVVTSEEGDTYYTLDGVKVQTPSKGIYIKRSANGTTKKVSFK